MHLKQDELVIQIEKLIKPPMVPWWDAVTTSGVLFLEVRTQFISVESLVIAVSEQNEALTPSLLSVPTPCVMAMCSCFHSLFKRGTGRTTSIVGAIWGPLSLY